MAYSSRACESLESRRMLSADIGGDLVEPDLPLADDTTDVVVADGREQVYPPLAPAGWTDESIGSFEEPAAITVAFYGRDPVDQTPVEDDGPGEGISPSSMVASSIAAASRETRVTSIAREVLGTDQDASVTA
jgi:hypothetical protein